MAEGNIAVPCPAGEYTLIVSGKASVSFSIREESRYGRWKFAASQPDVDTIHYKTLRPRSSENFNDLSISAKIWFRPEGDQDLTIEVVTS